MTPRRTPGLSLFTILQLKKRADERTRTADLISLRVRGRALRGVARGCSPLHRIALAVVSEWYQYRPCVRQTQVSTSSSCESTLSKPRRRDAQRRSAGKLSTRLRVYADLYRPPGNEMSSRTLQISGNRAPPEKLVLPELSLRPSFHPTQHLTFAKW